MRLSWHAQVAVWFALRTPLTTTCPSSRLQLCATLGSENFSVSLPFGESCTKMQSLCFYPVHNQTPCIAALAGSGAPRSRP